MIICRSDTKHTEEYHAVQNAWENWVECERRRPVGTGRRKAGPRHHHPLDLILWTVESSVTEVYAYSNKLSIPVFPAADCYIVILQFENGVTGKVYVTSGCSGHGMAEGMGGGFLAVYGTEGTLWKGQLYRRDEKPVPIEESSAHEVVGGHGWARSVVDYLDLLDGKIGNPIPARIGARIVAVCEAALESIRTKQPQSLHWF